MTALELLSVIILVSQLPFVISHNETKCVTSDHCPKNSGCTRTRSGPVCTCLHGYVRFGRECVDIDECAWGVRTCDYSLAECINTDGGFTCTCKDGYVGDGVTCYDINECAVANDCDPRPDMGRCTNTVGSYTCGCRPGYTLAPDLTTCRVTGQTYPDRNGGWSAWSEWGGCSASCGSGQRTQTRRCDDPSTDGAGRPCPGERANVEPCNIQQCPLTDVEAEKGIFLYTHGVARNKFAQVFHVMQATLAAAVNAYCNRNTINVGKCCRLDTKYVPDQHHQKTFIQKDGIVQGDSYPKEALDSTITHLLVFKYQKTNALCLAATRKSRRTRRATSGVVLLPTEDAVDQELLQDILNNDITKAELKEKLDLEIRNVFGGTSNITVTDVKSASQVPYYAPPATTTATTEKPDRRGRGTKAWIVAVVVMTVIIIILVVIVLVLCLLKRSKLIQLFKKESHPQDTEQDPQVTKQDQQETEQDQQMTEQDQQETEQDQQGTGQDQKETEHDPQQTGEDQKQREQESLQPKRRPWVLRRQRTAVQIEDDDSPSKFPNRRSWYTRRPRAQMITGPPPDEQPKRRSWFMRWIRRSPPVVETTSQKVSQPWTTDAALKQLSGSERSPAVDPAPDTPKSIRSEAVDASPNRSKRVVSGDTNWSRLHLHTPDTPSLTPPGI